jgi:hypothetical protein
MMRKAIQSNLSHKLFPNHDTPLLNERKYQFHVNVLVVVVVIVETQKQQQQ